MNVERYKSVRIVVNSGSAEQKSEYHSARGFILCDPIHLVTTDLSFRFSMRYDVPATFVSCAASSVLSDPTFGIGRTFVCTLTSLGSLLIHRLYVRSLIACS